MALEPPMVIDVGLFKFVIVTSVPTEPVVGVKLVMVGACANALVNWNVNEIKKNTQVKCFTRFKLTISKLRRG
ncbi:hypothetical protein [Pedobacter glucosidilyticus]|uniref:hypothetical protein n=1 Tax=Pedobacter glucosidilyticus TaxID=1122941 RepID=UPI0026EF77EA|nr:hypothetical protein [Pedobacter glucosidilyticus]